MKFCKKESKLLQADMLSTLQYWLDRVKCIDGKLMELQASPNIQYCRGVICLLTHLKHDSEIKYKKATYISSQNALMCQGQKTLLIIAMKLIQVTVMKKLDQKIVTVTFSVINCKSLFITLLSTLNLY